MQAIGNHFRVKLEDIAIKMTLYMMSLYNLYIAVVLGVIKRNLFVTCFFPPDFGFSPIIWTKKMEY